MNLLCIVAAVLLFINVVTGYKRGMVRQVISFISLVVLCTIVVLIGNGLQSYYDGKFLNVAAVVLLLAVLGIAHHLLGLVFFPAKMVTKLPVVHWLDKLLGIVAGALETVLLIWTLDTFVMMMDLGMIGQMIVAYTAENEVLSWFYRHNYLAHLVEQIIGQIPVMK